MNLYPSYPEFLNLLCWVSLIADTDPSMEGGTWASWFAPTGTAAMAILLVLLCIIAWGTNLVALPGNWFSVALLALYVALGPQENRARDWLRPAGGRVSLCLGGRGDRIHRQRVGRSTCRCEP